VGATTPTMPKQASFSQTTRDMLGASKRLAAGGARAPDPAPRARVVASSANSSSAPKRIAMDICRRRAGCAVLYASVVLRGPDDAGRHLPRNS
jgi:hypothetical protein